MVAKSQQSKNINTEYIIVRTSQILKRMCVNSINIASWGSKLSMMMFMNKSVDRLMMQKSMEPIIKEIIDNKISKESHNSINKAELVNLPESICWITGKI